MTNPEFYRRSKHTDVRYQFICKKLRKNVIDYFMYLQSRKSRNVDTDTQSKIFDKNNTIALPYFDQI